MQSAHFAVAYNQHSTELSNSLSELLGKLGAGENVGVEPYRVPRRLIDPKFCRWVFWSIDLYWLLFRTGNLLLDPVLPKNAPNLHTIVNQELKDYFEAEEAWPTGSFILPISHFVSVARSERGGCRMGTVFLSPVCGLKLMSFKISGERYSSCQGFVFL